MEKSISNGENRMIISCDSCGDPLEIEEANKEYEDNLPSDIENNSIKMIYYYCDDCFFNERIEVKNEDKLL